MLDPVSRALANAPIDDEPITDEEERAVAEARQSLQNNRGMPWEEAVPQLGLTMDNGDWLDILRVRNRKDAYR